MRPEYRISWHNPLWPKLTPMDELAAHGDSLP